MSRYHDNIESFSFNVAGGYLIGEFNKMVKLAARNADLLRRGISICGILLKNIGRYVFLEDYRCYMFVWEQDLRLFYCIEPGILLSRKYIYLAIK